MEEISGTKSHKLILNNRRTGSFTGILDVLSFDVGEILLETELGMLASHATLTRRFILQKARHHPLTDFDFL